MKKDFAHAGATSRSWIMLELSGCGGRNVPRGPTAEGKQVDQLPDAVLRKTGGHPETQVVSACRQAHRWHIDASDRFWNRRHRRPPRT
jgi:hypothetical protein